MSESLRHILLIEDNPGDARLIQVTLEAYPLFPCKIIVAGRISEAGKLIASRDFDVILLDLSLPDSHGIETVDRVRTLAVDVPIVVVTGNTEAADGIRALERGAQDYLVKGDFDSAVVSRAIRYAIERKRASKRLQASEENARAKSAFLATMSHELRTPLHGVIGMIDLLRSTNLDRQQRQFADACQQSAELLLSVINDILDFSKIEAGKLELDYADFDLEMLLSDVANMMAPRVHAKHLEFLMDIDPDAKLMMRGDGNRLKQILVNLVSNAVKFTQLGEIAIRIAPERIDQERAIIRFSVTDTGIGIPQDRRDRLFTSFSQVDTSTSRKYGGTGLGLAICKNLVELMGGQIGVESEPDKGSMFWFTLSFERHLKIQPENRAVSKGDLRGLHVLIVDDNATNRLILNQQVSSWHMCPELAESAEQAIDLIQRANASNRPFDLALIDQCMPGKDGVDLAKEINGHAMQRPLTLLMLTSLDMPLAPNQLQELGIDEYLVKPIRQSILFDAIADAMQKREAREHGPIQPIESGTTLASISSTRILLVEDNQTNQLYAREILRRNGYHCDVANNGHEALKAVRQEKYHLVLMDCQMPEMDGFEATASIRMIEKDGTLHGHLPIVALTANAIKGDRERCLTAGMDDYLSKPVTPAELIKKIKQHTRDLGSERRPVDDAENDKADESLPMEIELAMERGEEDVRFYCEVLKSFVIEMPVCMAKLETAVRAGDTEAAARHAHSIKGAAGIVIGKSLHVIAAELEQLCFAGDREGMTRQLNELQRELDNCIHQADQIRRKLGGNAQAA